MHVHSPHVGSAQYVHGSMGDKLSMFAPQPLRCSGAYALILGGGFLYIYTGYTIFIRIKAGRKYTQGLKYMPGSAAE